MIFLYNVFRLFYELLLHPEVLLSCRKEINVNIGGIDAIKKTNNENEGLKQDCYEQKLHLPTFDTINKLKYCLFAIQESLRLHPPVPKVRKKKDYDVFFLLYFSDLFLFRLKHILYLFFFLLLLIFVIVICLCVYVFV